MNECGVDPASTHDFSELTRHTIAQWSYAAAQGAQTLFDQLLNLVRDVRNGRYAQDVNRWFSRFEELGQHGAEAAVKSILSMLGVPTSD